MAVLSLFITTRAKIGQLDLDASINETHEASSTLTKSEVEDDSGNVTDHVNLEPIKLTIEGVVSKNPLGNSALIGSLATAATGSIVSGAAGRLKAPAGLGGLVSVGVGSVAGLVSNAIGLDDLSDEGGNDRPKTRSPKDVFEYLLEIRSRRVPVEIVTALKIYDKMIMTNLVAVRNKTTREVLQFTATFEQIRIVSADTVNITGFSSIGGKAEDKTKLGKQAATKAAPKATDNSSYLLKGIKAIKPGFGD